MAQSSGEMVADAKSRIQNLTPEQVAEEMDSGDAVLIDIREANELDQSGSIPGALHAPRGMLEFYADPNTAYHRPEFDPSKRLILHCASGGRSALAADTLQNMGYSNVAHLDGGLNAWKESGKPVES